MYVCEEMEAVCAFICTLYYGLLWLQLVFQWAETKTASTCTSPHHRESLSRSINFIITISARTIQTRQQNLQYAHCGSQLYNQLSHLRPASLQHNSLMAESSTFSVTLKTATSNFFEASVNPNTTVQDLKTILQQKTSHPIDKIRLAYKGKLIEGSQTMQSLEIKDSTTIMVVLRKNDKKDEHTQRINPVINHLQSAPGDSNPSGFGNDGIMNHPGHMSALSSGVSTAKLQQMMDNPNYKKEIEQMMSDPEAMIKAIQSNPAAVRLMESNPMMKMMLSNPNIVKAIMTPENINMAMEMDKKGGLGAYNHSSGQGSSSGGRLGGMGPFGTTPDMGGFNNSFVGGMYPPQTQPSTNNNVALGINPYMMNLYMMNPYMDPFLMNRMMNPMSRMLSPNQNPKANPNSNTTFTVKGLSPSTSFSVPLENEQQRFKIQLQTLESMGYTDKQKNLEVLKIYSGNVEEAASHLTK